MYTHTHWCHAAPCAQCKQVGITAHGILTLVRHVRHGDAVLFVCRRSRQSSPCWRKEQGKSELCITSARHCSSPAIQSRQRLSHVCLWAHSVGRARTMYMQRAQVTKEPSQSSRSRVQWMQSCVCVVCVCVCVCVQGQGCDDSQPSLCQGRRQHQPRNKVRHKHDTHTHTDIYTYTCLRMRPQVAALRPDALHLVLLSRDSVRRQTHQYVCMCVYCMCVFAASCYKSASGVCLSSMSQESLLASFHAATSFAARWPCARPCRKQVHPTKCHAAMRLLESNMSGAAHICMWDSYSSYVGRTSCAIQVPYKRGICTT